NKLDGLFFRAASLKVTNNGHSPFREIVPLTISMDDRAVFPLLYGAFPTLIGLNRGSAEWIDRNYSYDGDNCCDGGKNKSLLCLVHQKSPFSCLFSFFDGNHHDDRLVRPANVGGSYNGHLSFAQTEWGDNADVSVLRLI